MLVEKTCPAFVEALASAAPVPGGGGAAALVGAVGTALGNMVGALTVGKKKYADAERELRAAMMECTHLQGKLLAMVDKDAACFAPLAAAYALPKDAPDRERILQEATALACTAPLEIMELCAQALACVSLFAQKGSRLALSDAGCAAVCCKAALQSAALNVFINTKALQDREKATALNERVNGLLTVWGAKADEIYTQVQNSLQ